MWEQAHGWKARTTPIIIPTKANHSTAMIIDRRSGPSETEFQKSRNESVILLLLVIVFDFWDGVSRVVSISISYCLKHKWKKGKKIIPAGIITALIAPGIKSLLHFRNLARIFICIKRICYYVITSPGSLLLITFSFSSALKLGFSILEFFHFRFLLSSFMHTSYGRLFLLRAQFSRCHPVCFLLFINFRIRVS